MAFTLEERQHMGIHGLLPPAVLSQDIQALRVMINFHRMNSKLILIENSYLRIDFFTY
jgi:malate dehydrogenase (oxaloacetate-decarboxylating)(NADP+)